MNKAQGYPKITALICTYNEEHCLPYVLPRIPDWIDEIILVDAHSTDRTVEVAMELRPDIKILYQSNKGKGNALKYGTENARGEIIVTLDADGQSDPVEIPRFIEPLLNGYDFAKGSRLADGRPSNMPWHRWFGNYLIVNTCNILYRTGFTDLCCGYNAFWRKPFLKVEMWAKDGWNYEPSIIAHALKNRMKVIEVAHCYRTRINGQSKLSDWKQGLNAIMVLIKERFHG